MWKWTILGGAATSVIFTGILCGARKDEVEQALLDAPGRCELPWTRFRRTGSNFEYVTRVPRQRRLEE